MRTLITVIHNNMKIFEVVAKYIAEIHFTSPFFLTIFLLVGRKCTVVMSNHFLFVKFNSHWWY